MTMRESVIPQTGHVFAELPANRANVSATFLAVDDTVDKAQAKAIAQTKALQASLAKLGIEPMQLKPAGQGVAQLGLLDRLKGAFGVGQDAVRRAKAKKMKLTGDIEDSAMGVYHGGGFASRYERLDAPTEQDRYDDLLDEEAAGRARMAAHPILEPARMLARGAAGAAISVGGDALNALVPGVGSAAGKIAGMGVDHADKQAQGHLEQGVAKYQVLRDHDDD